MRLGRKKEKQPDRQSRRLVKHMDVHAGRYVSSAWGQNVLQPIKCGVSYNLLAFPRGGKTQLKAWISVLLAPNAESWAFSHDGLGGQSNITPHSSWPLTVSATTQPQFQHHKLRNSQFHRGKKVKEIDTTRGVSSSWFGASRLDTHSQRIGGVT
jgi:hypothetical protein